jgi:hypothetical protein
LLAMFLTVIVEVGVSAARFLPPSDGHAKPGGAGESGNYSYNFLTTAMRVQARSSSGRPVGCCGEGRPNRVRPFAGLVLSPLRAVRRGGEAQRAPALVGRRHEARGRPDESRPISCTSRSAMADTFRTIMSFVSLPALWYFQVKGESVADGLRDR